MKVILDKHIVFEIIDGRFTYGHIDDSQRSESKDISELRKLISDLTTLYIKEVDNV